MDFVRQVFAVIADAPQHTYQVLTKRSSRLPKICRTLGWSPNLWMGVLVEDASAVLAPVRTELAAAVPGRLRGIRGRLGSRLASVHRRAGLATGLSLRSPGQAEIFSLTASAGSAA